LQGVELKERFMRRLRFRREQIIVLRSSGARWVGQVVGRKNNQQIAGEVCYHSATGFRVRWNSS
jgi:hypothetical protein